MASDVAASPHLPTVEPWMATARGLLEEAWADLSEQLANGIVGETVSATGWARQSAFFGARDVLCDGLRPYREAGVERVAATIEAAYRVAIANGADQVSAFRRARVAGHEAARHELSEPNVKDLKAIRSAAAACALRMARQEQDEVAMSRASVRTSAEPKHAATRRTSTRSSTSRRRPVRRGSSAGRLGDDDPEPPPQLALGATAGPA